MLQVLINGEEYKLLQPLPNKVHQFTLISVSINLVPKGKLIPIMLWVREAMTKCNTDYVTYNSYIVTPESVITRIDKLLGASHA